MQLQQEGKYYGTALYDRLLLSETKLKHIASTHKDEVDIAHDRGKLLGDSFTSLSIREIPLSEYYAVSNINKSEIKTESSSNGNEIFITVQTLHSNNKAIQLTAKLSKDYLWDKNNSSSSIYDYCILNHDNAKLFCSNKSALSFNNLNVTDGSKRKVQQWSQNNIDYISSNRILFLKSRFNSNNWNIITIQTKKEMFAPAENFNQLFYLVIALTLLIVVLLSTIQIRRSLIPLKKLIHATQHLANSNFNKRIEIKSNNEFYKLAQAFNSMSERLKNQFSALTVLSNIDQLILTSPDSEHIYLTIFEYINNIAPCDVLSITILENDAPNIGNTFLSESNNLNKSINERVKLDDSELSLLTESIGRNLLLNIEEQNFLQPIKKYNVTTAYIFPIAVDNKLSAFITLGFVNLISLNKEDTSQVKNISDRLAVAISAAERDKKLYQQSYYDSLTGLPNRQLLNTRLEKEISNSIRNNKNIALLFLDIDRFKRVNDTLGHPIGDELLMEVSNRLLKCIRETDTVARLGGDEFTIILSGPIETKYISHVADKIIAEISKPFYIKGNEIFIGTSIGISVFPNDGTNRVELLKNADTAMYRVKESGRGKHLFFEEQMNIDEMERASLENDMRKALERNEFKLHYQPLIDLNSGKIVGAEALIRWHHSRRGLVPTEKFICLAEETGFMEKIGEWVLFTACSQFNDWQNTGCQLERISVNVSSRQFLQNDFIKMLDSILDKTNMPANKLELEITETLLMDEQIDTNKILQKISKKGIQLSIDDFGTGFSSLSYLKRFPLSTLKIDRSFMQDVPHNEDACSIVKSIITLGHTLKLEVIAEGIESQLQLNLLTENKCNYAQGFYFSPAVSAGDFSRLIQEQNNRTKTIYNS